MLIKAKAASVTACFVENMGFPFSLFEVDLKD